MVALYFVPSQCPRTWTKQEWKENYRWVRVMQKLLNAELEKRRDIIAQQWADLAIFGTTNPHHLKMKEDFINNMINPPLLLGPGMEPK